METSHSYTHEKLIPQGETSHSCIHEKLIPQGETHRLKTSGLIPQGETHRLKTSGLIPQGETHRLKTSGLIPQGETHRLKTSGLIPQGEGYFSKDYVKSIRNSNDYKENEIASNDFIVRNLINCVEYGKKWSSDPFHAWSRQFEYPWVTTQIKNLVNKSVRVMDAGSG